jgi:hypothetical protein
MSFRQNSSTSPAPIRSAYYVPVGEHRNPKSVGFSIPQASVGAWWVFELVINPRKKLSTLGLYSLKE